MEVPADSNWYETNYEGVRKKQRARPEKGRLAKNK
jgi:hypothetical protein